MDSAQGSDLVPTFGDLNLGEKLSEIKLPLVKVNDIQQQKKEAVESAQLT